MAFDDPKPPRQPPRDADDIAAVLFYLRFAAEDGLVFNMTTGREAFDAFARLLDQDPAALWDRTGTA